MFDIPKRGTCYVLRFVPLDNTYTNTLWWEHTSAGREKQIAYFKSKAKKIPSSDSTFNSAENISYTRHTNGIVRLQCNAEYVLDCNYIMFQNAPSGQQWYYAFITSVEFINEHCTEITYEIDVMQTWYFNYQLGECFIKREHSAHDYFGENVMPESALPIPNVFPYKITPDEHIGDDWSIIVGISYDPDEPEKATTSIVSNVYSGLKYKKFSASESGYKEFEEFVQTMTDASKIDGIVGCILMPTFYSQMSEKVTEAEFQFTPRKVFGIEGGNNTGVYTPKNNKLYQYPYNFLTIDSGEIENDYRFEFFRDLNTSTGDTPQPIPYGNQLKFKVRAVVSLAPQISVTPYDYLTYDPAYWILGSNNNDEFSTIMQNFPQVAFNVDTFKVWWAQNFITVGAQAFNAATEMAVGTAMAYASPDKFRGTQTILGGFNSAVNTIANVATEARKPNHIRGNNNANLDVACRYKTFLYKQMQISAQEAKYIDEYFDLYGYETNLLKVPNFESIDLQRPHWNYIQMSQVNFRYNNTDIPTSIPTEASQRIIQIYQQGITFWINPDEVGNYNLDNRPKGS